MTSLRKQKTSLQSTYPLCTRCLIPNMLTWKVSKLFQFPEHHRCMTMQCQS